MASRRQEDLLPGTQNPDFGKDFVKRQDSFIPDNDVNKVARSFKVENNQFRKHVFVDGSSTVAPMAFVFGSKAPDNGAPKQGINTVFKPKPAKENGGFIYT
jgi:hypothetical protein